MAARAWYSLRWPIWRSWLGDGLRRFRRQVDAMLAYWPKLVQLVACRREIVSMGFREKVGPNSWNPPCVNLLLAFGCGDRSNTFSATGH
jgi:hypothetical protein